MITENKKTFFEKKKNQKKTGDDAKKTKRLTEIQVSTKKFTTRVLKKTKVTQLFKPINYWEMPLLHGQINLIKYVELNKFEKA